jgi:hypothetical protein
VLKLFRALDNDPDRQVAFYHPGLGTMEAAAALTSVARHDEASRPRRRLRARIRRARRLCLPHAAIPAGRRSLHVWLQPWRLYGPGGGVAAPHVRLAAGRERAADSVRRPCHRNRDRARPKAG